MPALARPRTLVLTVLAALALAAPAARADEAAHQNVGRDRVAVQGYDVVSYFFAGKWKGTPALSATYNGAVYHFANEHNLRLFRENPAKYAPAYGGWCATAMAEGRKVEIDPGNFRITNGRLFLFYKGLFQDAQTDWAKDEPNKTAAADASWKKLVGG
ncbi:MAG TPA: YHS domain-containing (seleno)protein [Humisphaera sp.]